MKRKALAAILFGMGSGLAQANLSANFYNGWSVVNGDIAVPQTAPYKSEIVPNIDFWDGNMRYSWQNRDLYTVIFSGYLDLAAAGSYIFQTTSDDGIQVWVDGNKIINAPVLQWFETWTANPLMLTAGQHTLQVRYFENYGDDGLVLRWEKPGDAQFSVVPASVLSVPEPETYAMMVAGLGLLGVIARRRVRS